MSRQSFQAFRHIDHTLYIFFVFVPVPKLRVHCNCPFNGNARLVRNTFCNRIHKCIRQIHHTPHIPDDSPCRKRTKRNDLRHTVSAVLFNDVIDHFLPPLETEIHVDIGHGNTFRIQETLKNQMIPDRVDIRNSRRICDKASRSAAAAGSHADAVFPGVPDIIPYNQKILHIPHIFDHGKLIFQAFVQLFCHQGIPLVQPFVTELFQIFISGIPFRHRKIRQLCVPEFNLHMTAVGNFLCILHGFQRIRKQRSHFRFGFDIILSSLITHPVFIGELFPCL